jgi:hypothetical protein
MFACDVFIYLLLSAPQTLTRISLNEKTVDIELAVWGGASYAY